MFSVKYETRYGDYKNYEIIKIGSLLDIIQDISTKDSARCGYDMNKLRAMNRAWFLQGINLYIHKPVSIHKDIYAETAVKSLRLATSERCCVLKQDGEMVASSVANWFLFDTDNKKIAKVPDEMTKAFTYVKLSEDIFSYKKLRTISLDTPDYEITVSNKEIDTNRHLNNQKSAELLMDALPFEAEFNFINILYKKSAYLGDKLSVYKTEIENGYYVHLSDEKDEICVVGEFKNI